MPIDQARTTPATPGVTCRARWLWLSAILLIGALLRGVGLTFGFPLRVHADEWAIVDNAIDLARRNSFEPVFLDRPDHFEIKLNFLVDTAYSWARYRLSLVDGFLLHELDFVLIGRTISALFGVGCIWLAYLIVRRFSVSAGLIAAGLVATFPPLVVNAHYATPESPQAFFTLLFILATVLYLERPAIRWLVCAAVCIGVGFTIKYPAVILGVVLAVIIGVAARRCRSWRVFLGHGALSLAAVVGTILVISPVLVTDFGKVIAEIQRQGRPVHPGADGLDWFGNLIFYAQAFTGSAGILLSLAAVGGAAWCLWHRRRETLPLWSGLVYWLVLSAVALHWVRWGIPMFLSPLLFAGLGIDASIRWAWRLRLAPRWVTLAVRGVAVALASLIGLNLLVSSVAAVSGLAATDTRVSGLGVLRDVGATPSNTVFEGYTSLLPNQPQTIFDYFTLSSGTLQLTAKAPADARFLLVSDGVKARYVAEAKYVSQQEFYAAVDRLPLVAVVEPVAVSSSLWEPLNIWKQVDTAVSYWSGGVSGPTLYLYDISAVARMR